MKKIKSVREIPIIGRISAGHPIEAIKNIEDTISIVNPKIKTTEGYYALQVKPFNNRFRSKIKPRFIRGLNRQEKGVVFKDIPRPSNITRRA